MSEPVPAPIAAGAPRAASCLRSVESGVAAALRGEHAQAIERYREAMSLAAALPEGDVLIRHCTTCVLESLEWMGSYEGVIAHCRRVIAHYEAHPPSHPLARRDWAGWCERLGVLSWKAEGPSAARAPLEQASALARALNHPLPLAEALLSWIRAGYHVDPRRLVEEQRRWGYFTVREPPPRHPSALAAQPSVHCPAPRGDEHGPG